MVLSACGWLGRIELKKVYGSGMENSCSFKCIEFGGCSGGRLFFLPGGNTEGYMASPSSMMMMLQLQSVASSIRLSGECVQ